jgi:hypothetical protein
MEVQGPLASNSAETYGISLRQTGLTIQLTVNTVNKELTNTTVQLDMTYWVDEKQYTYPAISITYIDSGPADSEPQTLTLMTEIGIPDPIPCFDSELVESWQFEFPMSL